jgi:hypothetical protein
MNLRSLEVMRFMILDLHRLTTSRLPRFMIPDLHGLPTSRLRKFEIPDLDRLATSRLHRFVILYLRRFNHPETDIIFTRRSLIRLSFLDITWKLIS